MSAFLSVVKRGSIEVIADGIGFDEGGIVREMKSKIESLGDMPGVVVGRGHLVVLRTFAEVARTNCRTFDDVIANYTAIMMEVVRIGFASLGKRLANHEIFLAGWSEAHDRPETYWEGMHRAWEGADGFLRDGGAAFWAGPLQGKDAFLARFGDGDGYLNPERLETFNAETDGLNALETMRQEKVPLVIGDPNSVVGHGVGGFAEHVTVTRTGVDRRIIRVWPDEVGRRIEPSNVKSATAQGGNPLH